GRARRAARADRRADGRAALVARPAGVDGMAVALDVAALAADDEDDRVGVERVRDPAVRRRAGVEEAALFEVARLALDLDADLAAVDEVQLVLRVVEV